VLVIALTDESILIELLPSCCL